MVIKPVSEQQQYPLNENQAMALMGLMMNCGPEATANLQAVIERDPMSQLIQRRGAFHGMQVTAGLTAYLVLVSEGIPGRAVQLLHALAVNTRESEVVDIGHFCHIFHTGLPNEAGFLAAWDAQKDEQGKNLLDTTVWERKQ